jgi:hypothetical protein
MARLAAAGHDTAAAINGAELVINRPDAGRTASDDARCSWQA